MKIYTMISVALMLAVSACTNSEDAHRALRNSGYTDIQTGDYAFFACGRDDFYHTKFTAKNQQGQFVSGVVCSGLFLKGATVRF